MSDTTPRPRRSKARNSHVTRSGKTIKLNRSLTERMKASKEAKARRKAEYLSTLPKEPWKRVLYRLHPKRLYRYWFSRDGLIMALKLTGIGFVVMFLLIVGLFAYFRKDLPKIKDLSGNDFGGSITYTDKTGKVVLFRDYDAIKRVPVAGDKINKYMKQATVAVEDKDFYHEGAFNVKGITRAAINNATGGSTQGGSTITQQLVKLNEGWTNDHTVSRKVKELILAVELEREYNKDDILNAYLNLAPYGNVDYGVQIAAQDYFHVDAANLSLAQAAMLASIPKAPGTYSPFSSPVYNPALSENNFDSISLIARQHYTLDLMAKQGYITQKDADAAKKVDILAQVQKIQSNHYSGIQAPYFVLAAREELLKDFPAAVVKKGGWTVTTTLDMNLQALAEKSLADNKYKLDRYSADNAAFVSEDVTTGQVVALIGGVDFSNDDYGKVNYATDVNISPGSSVKPYDYTTFINNNTNVGAGSALYDSTGPLPVNGYQCTNRALPEANAGGNCLFDYDRRSFGPITLRYALGGSRNIPAVKAMISSVPGDTSTDRITSVNKVISTASALMGNPDGYRCYNTDVEDFFSVTKADEAQCGAASGIGDGAYLHLNDHVNGVASLSRLGKAIPQTFILKVTNSSGKVLKQWTQPTGTQVVKQDSAYIVDNMASDPKASYLNGSCTETNCSAGGQRFHRYKGWNTAIKTGTTNFNYDGLMMTWNTQYASGIWVGNHTRTKAFTTSPENMTDPIMKEYNQGALDMLGNVQPINWTQPSDIKTASAYVMHSAPYGTQNVPSPTTDIFPSWYVGKTSSVSQTIDKVSGKIATSCTPTLAKQSSTNGAISVWNVDIFNGGNASSTASSHAASNQGTDDVHNCTDGQPSITITAVNGVSATSGSSSLTCPASGCVIMVHIEQGTHALTDPAYPNYPGTLNLTVNGQVVQSQAVSDSGDYQITYTPPAGSLGDVSIQVQVIDSVLYQGTDTKTITIKSGTTTSKAPTTGAGTGNGNGNGPGNAAVATTFPTPGKKPNKGLLGLF